MKRKWSSKPRCFQHRADTHCDTHTHNVHVHACMQACTRTRTHTHTQKHSQSDSHSRMVQSICLEKMSRPQTHFDIVNAE